MVVCSQSGFRARRARFPACRVRVWGGGLRATVAHVAEKAKSGIGVQRQGIDVKMCDTLHRHEAIL